MTAGAWPLISTHQPPSGDRGVEGRRPSAGLSASGPQMAIRPMAMVDLQRIRFRFLFRATRCAAKSVGGRATRGGEATQYALQFSQQDVNALACWIPVRVWCVHLSEQALATSKLRETFDDLQPLLAMTPEIGKPVHS